jgi:gamma-glutamyltranspeptidase/glutathione hydrolase
MISTPVARTARARALSALACSALLAGALASACRGPDPFDEAADWPTPRAGAVVSEHELASAVGLEVLRQGGNAADAALATALALAVVFPRAGNLGGGGFALWVPHEGEAVVLDFRETAPEAIDARLYRDDAGALVASRSVDGPLAVAVPGSPAGLFELHRRHGSKRFHFADLARPAIDLARGGFTVDARLAEALAVAGRRERMNDAARALLYPGGRALREGERLRQPDLARTLERLAAAGPRGFYQGPVADAIVETLSAERARQAGPGDTPAPWITQRDLADYRVLTRTPLSGWFRGMEILTVPPPSSGGIVLLQVLDVFEGLPIDAERDAALRQSELARDVDGQVDPDPALSARFVHWLIEALRGAFADRAEHMGDPDRVRVPVAELLAPSWIARRRIAIGDRADPDVRAWGSADADVRESAETTHLSVLDRQGNAVSLTTTLNGNFGSGILVEEGGFFLNNEVDDFALAPGTPNMFGLVGGAANAPAAGKRPLSSMTPTVVRDGGHTVTLVLGSPGGPRIITAVLEVLLRVLVLGEELEDAVAAPRLHQQWRPSVTEFERGWDPELLAALANRHGQETVVLDETFGSVQAIWVPLPGARPIAVTDPRRAGGALVE